MISGFEKNSLGSRAVERLLLEESGGKALSGKGSGLELHPRLEGGSKDLSVFRRPAWSRILITNRLVTFFMLFC